MQVQSLSLLKSPFTTIHYFIKELIFLISLWKDSILRRKFKIFCCFLLISGIIYAHHYKGTYSYILDPIINFCLLACYWTFIGVLSSIGLGSGLHTFVLYLGPFVARVTLAAWECSSLDFPSPPFPHEIICPDSILAASTISIWKIWNKVKMESFFWGVGTALGELPPYMIAKAGSRSGSSQSSSVFHESSCSEKTKSFLNRLISKFGFFGILALASVPNPLFDLAGVMCGHYNVPFPIFFSATLIGKAFIKSSIQTLFVIICFSTVYIEHYAAVCRDIPIIGEKAAEYIYYLSKIQRESLHSSGGNLKRAFSYYFDKIVLLIVLYFVCSMVSSLASDAYKRENSVKEIKLN